MHPNPSEQAGDETDIVIARLAAAQHGAVARPQLLTAGVPAHRIDYRLRHGRLVRLHRGVYGVGPVPGRHRREMAAVLAAGPGAALGGSSAAGLLGLAAAPAAEAPVTVTTERDVRTGDPGIQVRRCTRLPDDEVRTVSGVPATTAARTLMDLADSLPDQELERAVAKALRRDLVRPGELRQIAGRHSRLPRARRLARLLDGDDVVFTRSEAERRFLALLQSARLPRPAVNRVVKGHEVDFLWRQERLVVEVDGRAYHSEDGAFEGDRARDGRLIAPATR